MSTIGKRLVSLDLLRGFDLFCLLMLQPILMTGLGIKNDPAWEPVMAQFEHVGWQGFAFWDIIMPLFMFMSGITIPFAMSRYKGGQPIDRHFYYRLFKRFFILFLLGWVVQGNLLAFDVRQFHVFANTLQSIAVGYLVTTLLYVHFSLKAQIGFAVAFFSIYLLVFATVGGMNVEPGTNVAEVIDRQVLGHFRDGVIWQGDSWRFSNSYHYTWILSSFNFIVTVMLGCFAGAILRLEKEAKHRLGLLLIVGAVLVAVGLLMSPWFPIVKRIWSSSMTLFSGGICFLLMALFYYVVDIKGYTRGIGWLRYYGMNSIVAYCLFEVVNFRSISYSLFFGLEQWMGVYYPLVGTCVQSLIVLLIVKWMYDHQLFFKV